MSDPLEMPYAGVTRNLRRMIDGVQHYFGLGGAKRRIPVNSPTALANFLDTRSAFMAQTSLYGYLRTRAGTRYAELFEDEVFIELLNIAKWHIWLDCLGDLACFSGYLLLASGESDEEEVGRIMLAVVEAVLAKTGKPEEAGEKFLAHVEKVRERIRTCDWGVLEDGEACFSASPDSLVEWAPIVETLKELDEGIVRNSVRFRWQEVRRNLRELLKPVPLLEAARR
jgi:hypothetical protein